MPSRWTLKKNRGVRLELVDLLADEHAVGAEVDDLLALEDLGRQLADPGVDHRLAAADRDDRSAALVDRGEALVDRELLLDRLDVLADPPAARAGQVAGVKRFEHQDHGELLGPGDLLLGHVAGDPAAHLKRKTHRATTPSDSACGRGDRARTGPFSTSSGRRCDADRNPVPAPIDGRSVSPAASAQPESGWPGRPASGRAIGPTAWLYREIAISGK